MTIRMANHWYTIGAFALALFVASHAHGRSNCGDCVTIVPGGPVVGQTWTAANSPYCVTGDLFISNLTIEPGVCVLVDGPWRLNIQTTIHAEGTDNEPITFTAKDSDVSKWKGLEFNQTVPGSVLRHCVFSHADDSAIRLIDTAPTIEHCSFVNNAASGHGGAIYAEMTSQTARIIGSTFSQNMTNAANLNGSFFGGAIYIAGPAELVECVFDGNIAHARNFLFADFQGAGGAVYSSDGDLVIERCLFTENVARCIDGACCNTNRARGANLYIAGGAGSFSISNSVLSAGVLSAPEEESGGGIYVASGDVTLTNVTIARNERAGLHVAGGNVTVRNSIFWQNNNSGQQIIGDACVDYSIVQNGFTGDCGDSNIAFNPAFSGPGTTLCDLTILKFSPAVDTGDPDPMYNDSDECSDPPYGTERNDIGAHGGPGACWSTPPSVPGDLNGDCIVGVADLLILLASWGQCIDCDSCPADLNNDCVVNVSDLLNLLANWG